jgi:hypothetical protein
VSDQLLPTVRRFWTQVDKTGECWIWTGEVNNKGYGRFSLYAPGIHRRVGRVLTHRLALMLTGVDLADGAIVMHSCDNPPCVNPAHLSVGTQTDNMRDCLAKGRMNLSGLELGNQVQPDPSLPYSCLCGRRFSTPRGLTVHGIRTSCATTENDRANERRRRRTS